MNQRTMWAAMIAVAMASGCGGKNQEDKAKSSVPAAAEHGKAKVKAGAAVGKALDAKKLDAAKNAAEISTRIEAWIAAQNEGKVDIYLAHYQPKHFKGIKRTSDKKIKKFDFAGWKRDRSRMFKRPMTVAAEELVITSWLDRGSKQKRMISEVRFIQRWKSGKYADHGTKLLRFWRDGRGRQRIIYEDMLNSEPGWERGPDGEVAKLDWSAPKSVAEADQLWRQLAPTGADYDDKLAAIPDDPELRRMLARALIDEGNFACDEYVLYEECGNNMDHEQIMKMAAGASSEWAPLPASATFDDACLRRRLALWALEFLRADDLPGLRAQLLSIAALGIPESELVEQVLFITSTSKDELRLALLRAATKAGQASIADDHVEDLGDAAMVTAATELRLPEAISELDDSKHLTVLIGLLHDAKLEVEVRGAIADRLIDDPDLPAGVVTSALVKVATSDEDCELAMTAALELADRGKPDYLPRRQAKPDLEAAMRALCMNVHDPDEKRELALWKSFMPDTGIDFYSTEEQDRYDDYDDELGDGDAPGEVDEYGEPDYSLEGEHHHVDEEEEESADAEEEDKPDYVLTKASISRKQLYTIDVDRLLGGEVADCPGKSGSCEAGNYDNKLTITFEKAKDGGYHLISLEAYSNSSCGC